MSGPFLIEIRIMGNLRWVCKQLIFDIYRKFRVRGAVKHRPVPHFTLFGPFNCKSVKKVIEIIKETGEPYSQLEYQAQGFGYFESKKKFLFFNTSTRKHVVYLKINPSDDLRDFRYALAKKLLKTCNSTNFDHQSKNEFHFHATLAMKDIDSSFDDIWAYLKKYNITQYAVAYRITLLRKGKIVCEYDFRDGNVLDRFQVLRRFRYR